LELEELFKVKQFLSAFAFALSFFNIVPLTPLVLRFSCYGKQSCLIGSSANFYFNNHKKNVSKVPPLNLDFVLTTKDLINFYAIFFLHYCSVAFERLFPTNNKNAMFFFLLCKELIFNYERCHVRQRAKHV
jgi:hypothetical protein